MTTWANWWLYLWAAVGAALIALVFLLAFPWWCLAALIGFGTMEGVGLAVGGSYPPLTSVIRRYLPEWLAFLLIYSLTGAAGETWITHLWHSSIPHAVLVGGVVGLLGWFTAHFVLTYQEP